MAATNGFLNGVADAATALGNSISLHTADPGTTGASEVAGGAYARKTTTWGAAAIVGGNAVATGSTVRFDVPASTAALWYGVWSGGTFRYARPLTPSVTIGSSGPGQIDVTPTYTYSQT